jgi:hypothetical protein
LLSPLLRTIDLESLTKIAGLAGSAFATLKVCATYVVDLSLKRRIAKTVDDVDSTFARLVKIDGQEIKLKALDLQEFKLQVEQDLRAKVQKLRILRAQKFLRGTKRNEDPKGIQRWLLVYRPEGFGGLMVQSLYYFCICAAFAIVITACKRALVLHRNEWFFAIFLLPLVLVGVYARSISLRLKIVGNRMRRSALADPNKDINWLRRNTLVLKQGGGWSEMRVGYYGFLIVTALFFLQYPLFSSQWFRQLPWDLFCLLIAEAFKTDALSQRAQSCLSIPSGLTPDFWN